MTGIATVPRVQRIEQPLIGKPLPAIDARLKVTGEAVYLEDLRFPRMLVGKVLRSPLPHARIKRIDVSKALALPGVRAVITAKDTPMVKFSFVQALADRYPLCVDRVRFVGDEVAAVAADDELTAEKALKLIEVEYEELPAVFDPLEALAPDSIRIHEKGNIAYEVSAETGNLAEGFRRADYVFEETFRTSRQAHCSMELTGCIAHWQRSGMLLIWCQTQAPHTLREELARILNISSQQIQVVTPTIGGGFGGRMVMDMIVPIASLLSRRTGCPVRILKTREEELISSRTRYPYIFRVKLGLTREGHITAMHVDVTGDNGAYNDKGPATVNFQAACMMISYDAHQPALRHDARLVYTNKQPGTAFRGFGHIEEKFAVETLLNRAAQALGLDPFEIRRRNLRRDSELACLELLRERVNVRLSGSEGPASKTSAGTAQPADVQTHGTAWKASAPSRERRGVGIAMSAETGGGVRYYGYNSTGAMVKVDRDGMVTVLFPGTDTGTGTTSLMAQIVANELGCSVERVRVVGGNTTLTPYDLGTWASRTTYVVGNAVRAAALQVRSQLVEVAAQLLEASPSELVAQDDHFWVAGQPERRVGFQEVVKEIFDIQGRVVVGVGTFFDEKAPQCRLGAKYEDYFPVVASCAHAAEVTVDEETGLVRVRSYVAAHDVGRVLNPLGASGQVEGGVMQGIGFALFEELQYVDGQPVNPNWFDYRLPTFEDLPEMETLFVEYQDSDGPYGAKGIGEVPMGGPAPAIASAIEAAVGVRLLAVPMTPEAVWRAMRDLDNRR